MAHVAVGAIAPAAIGAGSPIAGGVMAQVAVDARAPAAKGAMSPTCPKSPEQLSMHARPTPQPLAATVLPVMGKDIEFLASYTPVRLFLWYPSRH